MALPLDSRLGLPCVTAVLDEAISRTVGELPGAAGCIGANFSTALLDELHTAGSVPADQRSIEDVGTTLGNAALDCGADAVQDLVIEQVAGAAALEVVGTLTSLCTAAEILHECVDSRIQTCDQIWNQAMSVFVGRSIDPNSMVGPVDARGGPYVNPERRLTYTTNFENLAGASLSAQMIAMSHRIDHPERLDWSTLRYERLTLGNRSFDLRNTDPSGRYFDLRPAVNLLAALAISANPIDGILFVLAYGVDPITGLMPSDARGILEPNRNPPEGEGSLQWSIMAAPNQGDGDALSLTATIRFDTELPIATNAWTNLVDTTLPLAQLQPALPGADSLQTILTVLSTDSGSGVAWQGIQALVPSGATAEYMADTSGVVVHRAHAPGLTKFTAIARDAVGHVSVAGSSSSVTILLPWQVSLGVGGAGTPNTRRWYAYPSPVRDGVLRFEVPEPGARIDLQLYDVSGREVATYRQVGEGAGSRPAEWRISSDSVGRLPGGLYFLRGRVGSQDVQQKIVLLQ